MHDDDELMAALRGKVLDDDVPVSSLLRTCLMLGKRVGATGLVDWSRSELEGYDTDADLPRYRILNAPLFAKTYFGTRIEHQLISPLHIPKGLRDLYLRPTVDLRQTIEEIERMAAGAKESLPFSSGKMTVLASEWTEEMGEHPYRGIENVYHSVSAAQLAGVTGSVRTVLVEMVGDLTQALPMSTLPTREKVESAVSVNVYGNGDHNHVSIGGDASNVNVGTEAVQNVGSTMNEAMSDVVAAIAEVRGRLSEIDDDEQRAAAADALDDLEAEVVAEEPNPEQVRKRGRIFETVMASPATSAALAEAVKSLLPAALEAFGS